jgi:hypothetical protein
MNKQVQLLQYLAYSILSRIGKNTPDLLNVVAWKYPSSSTLKTGALEPAILAFFSYGVILSLGKLQFIRFLWLVGIHCHVTASKSNESQKTQHIHLH